MTRFSTWSRWLAAFVVAGVSGCSRPSPPPPQLSLPVTEISISDDEGGALPDPLVGEHDAQQGIRVAYRVPASLPTELAGRPLQPAPNWPALIMIRGEGDAETVQPVRVIPMNRLAPASRVSPPGPTVTSHGTTRSIAPPRKEKRAGFEELFGWMPRPAKPGRYRMTIDLYPTADPALNPDGTIRTSQTFGPPVRLHSQTVVVDESWTRHPSVDGLHLAPLLQSGPSLRRWVAISVVMKEDLPP